MEGQKPTTDNKNNEQGQSIIKRVSKDMNKISYGKMDNPEKTKNSWKRKSIIIVLLQILFIAIVLITIVKFYPQVDVRVSGNFVKVQSEHADYIVMSKNKDFLSPVYLNIKELNNVTLMLEPGVYYWKAYNGVLTGFVKEFSIASEVSMIIDRDNISSNLMNTGNVRLNITRSNEGVMTGRMILDPLEKHEIIDKGEVYLGRENQ